MRKCYLDTETVGLYGMPVLLQYAFDEGEIHLYNLWKEPVKKTLALVDEMMECCVVMFNGAFDHFMLCKLYTTWLLLDPDMIPETDVRLVAEKEKGARDGPCLKPANTLDLMLHSRKGEFQCLMNRDPVRIRRVPSVLAGALVERLEEVVEVDTIMFAKRADPTAPKWKVYDRTDNDGNVDPDFKDVTLVFSAGGGLKFLAEHVLKIMPDAHFKDIELPKSLRPVEKGYVPFALGMSTPEEDWEVYDGAGKLLGQAWPGIIHHHIEHWAHNKPARDYARDDVKYTRELDKYFGYPTPGDDDSVLACMVAAVRWHGFVVDIGKAKELLEKARVKLALTPVNIHKPPQVRRYIKETMDDTEALLIDKSTKKANLEAIRDEMVVLEEGEVCLKCLGSGDYGGDTCLRCGGEGIMPLGPTQASRRASEILGIKSAGKEVELLAKLVEAGRFHASFNVIGALSSRMSGGDGLNAQGIKRSQEVREMFPLAWEGMVLCGGDFDSFEVVLADAVFGDVKLRQELMNGKKIHALMGMELYPGKTYEDIIATKGEEIDLYSRGKQGVFALLYGGDHNTIHNKLGVALKDAEAAFDNFQKRFPDIKKKREEVADMFQALKQPGGQGTNVVWSDPAEYAETFLGFRRYFSLENSIVKALYNLAGHLPKKWRNVGGKIVRTDRIQTSAGAVSSALYGAAFQLQAANTRAANNHLIQSAGAQITKEVQRKVWDVQPAGCNPWLVAPFNVHDEVMIVTHPSVVGEVTEAVTKTVVSYRERVPLIAMEFGIGMKNWGEKSQPDSVIRIFPSQEDFDAITAKNLLDALDDETEEGGGMDEWDGGHDYISSDDLDEILA